MSEQSYQIPKEIKSGIYIGAGIYLYDLIFVTIYWFIFSNLDFLIYEPLKAVYTAFNIIIAIYITRPVHSNPGKRRIHTILFILMNRKYRGSITKEADHEKEVRYEVRYIE